MCHYARDTVDISRRGGERRNTAGGFIRTPVAALWIVAERQWLSRIHLKFRTIRRRPARRSQGNSEFFRVLLRGASMPNGIAEGRYMDTSDRFLFFSVRGKWIPHSHRHARYFCETTLRYRARMHASATCTQAMYLGTHPTSSALYL